VSEQWDSGFVLGLSVSVFCWVCYVFQFYADINRVLQTRVYFLKTWVCKTRDSWGKNTSTLVSGSRVFETRVLYETQAIKTQDVNLLNRFLTHAN